MELFGHDFGYRQRAPLSASEMVVSSPFLLKSYTAQEQMHKTELPELQGVTHTIHGSQTNQSDARGIGFAVQSYIRTDVRQTKAHDYAQHARSSIDSTSMTLLPHPIDDMRMEDMTRRDQINWLWSNAFYAGANKRRDY